MSTEATPPTEEQPPTETKGIAPAGTPDPTPPPIQPPAPPAKVAQRWFRKVLANVPFFVMLEGRSQRVAFEPLSDNLAVLAVPEGSELDLALTKAALAKRGGVVSIDEATYVGLKKKHPFQPPKGAKRELLKIFNPVLPRKSPSPPSPRPEAPVAEAEPESVGNGVADGGGGPDGAGKPSSVPAFKPKTAKKSFKMPVTKKTNSRSLSGGVLEPETSE